MSDMGAVARADRHWIHYGVFGCSLVIAAVLVILNWDHRDAGIRLNADARERIGADEHAPVLDSQRTSDAPSVGFGWSKHESGVTESLTGIVWSGSQLVAVGHGGTLISSPDGRTWTRARTRVSTANYYTAVTYGGGRFVAVGTNREGSPDGAIIATSFYGSVWTEQSSAVAGGLNGVAYGHGLFVGVGNLGAVEWSRDAITWSAVDVGTTNHLDGVVFINGKFVVTGHHGTLLTSTDGKTWVDGSVGLRAWSGPDAGFNRVTYGNDRYLIPGAAATLTSMDNDLKRWSAAEETLNFRNAVFGDGMFVAIGTSGIRTSADGKTWNTAVGPAEIQGGDAAYTGSIFVVVGSSGKVFTSAKTSAATRSHTEPQANGAHATGAPSTTRVLGSQATITASSVLPNWKSFNFAPSNLVDNNLATSWQPDKNSRDGVGEWVLMRFSTRQTVTGFEFANGFQWQWQGQDLYTANHRIENALIQCSDGYEMAIHFDDIANTRTVTLPTPRECSWIKLLVKSVYKGSKWGDLAVSEFHILTRDADSSRQSPGDSKKDETLAIAIVMNGWEAWIGNDKEVPSIRENDPSRYPGALIELRSALDRLKFSEAGPAGSLGMVVTYSDKPVIRVPMGPLKEVTGNKLGTQADYFGQTGVELVSAIRLALGELKKAQVSRRVLIVIGDGNDTNNAAAKAQLQILRKQAAADQIQTFAIVYKAKLSGDANLVPFMISETQQVTTAENLPVALGAIRTRL